jgi:hemerythrin-like domain-containing protein
MDALTLVRQDHRKVEGLLDRCERIDGDAGDAGDERAVLVAQLKAALRHHVDSEESILYPIFRERARRSEVDLAPLDQAVEQHRLIERLSGELPDPAPADATFRAKLTVLTEQVRNHLDTEGSMLLSAIEDLVDDDTLLELGRRMEQRDRVIDSRRQLAAIVPGGARGRRVAAALVSLVALATAALAVVARRRRPPPDPPPSARRRRRRR